jgi:hypothetical protein
MMVVTMRMNVTLMQLVAGVLGEAVNLLASVKALKAIVGVLRLADG